MGVWQTVLQGDAISRSVALLLLVMSVASWVVILWKSWMLRRAVKDVQLSTAAFWQAAHLDDAQQRLQAFDPRRLVLPLLQAEVVPSGWVDSDAFLAGYGAAQAMPGPLFTFAAFLGASLQQPSSQGAALDCEEALESAAGAAHQGRGEAVLRTLQAADPRPAPARRFARPAPAPRLRHGHNAR